MTYEKITSFLNKYAQRNISPAWLSDAHGSLISFLILRRCISFRLKRTSTATAVTELKLSLSSPAYQLFLSSY
jgi:hypothetical protein